jgi:hypothetical protein
MAMSQQGGLKDGSIDVQADEADEADVDGWPVIFIFAF